MERFANEWKGFIAGKWCESIDVREFIQKNYKPYTKDESFLEGTTERTEKLKYALEVKLKDKGR